MIIKKKKEREVRNKVHERKMDLCRGMKKIKTCMQEKENTKKNRKNRKAKKIKK